MKIENLIDTHCHLTDASYYDENIDISELIQESYNEGVKKMICIGCTLEDSELEKIFKTCKLFDYVFCSIGIHPAYVKNQKISDVEKIRKYSNNSNFIAIGECGLDYFYAKTKEAQELQKQFLLAQIKIAINLGKPLVLHCRDAFDDLYKILLNYYKQVNGVIHCFTGNLEQAERFIKLGYYISFSGILTFKNAAALQEVAKKIPLDRILIETDSPYLAPEPYRGQTNFPKNVSFVAKKLASIKNLPVEEVTLELEENVKRLFDI